MATTQSFRLTRLIGADFYLTFFFVNADFYLPNNLILKHVIQKDMF